MKRIPLHAVPDEGYLPLAIRQWAQTSRRAIFAASDDSMLQLLAAAMPVFLPDRPTHVLPAWGTAPYERSRPSRAVTGMRVAGLVAIAESAGPCMVVTAPQALLQRSPSPPTDIGLAVACQLDANVYEKGIKISDTEMNSLNIKPASFHGKWNYTIAPRRPDG